MNKIEKIGIAGIGPFKKGVSLPIAPGVSFLYGKNVLNGGNANAVGKSLLGNAIADIFYEPQVRQDKPKAGKRFVQFTKGKNTVKIVHASQRGGRLQVMVNGEDVGARTASATKKKAAEEWGVTQDEFATYGYVDAAVPHPLVKGGTTARKAFFTSFFRLDQLDAEKKVFHKRLTEVRKVKAAHEELNKAFASARADMLSKDDKTKLEGELEEAQAELAVLRKRQEQAEKQQRLAAFKEVAGDKLTRLDEVTRSSKEIRKDIAAAEEAEEAIADYKLYQRELARYKEQTEGLDMSVPLNELKKLAAEYDHCEVELSRLQDIRAPSKPTDKVDKPGTPLADLERKERQLEHEVQHSRKFNKGVCGTCGQEVKARSLDEVQAELVQVEERIEAWADYTEYRRKLESYREKKEQYDDAQTRIAEISTRIKKLKPKKELYEKMKGLRKPEKVAKPDTVYDVAALNRELEITRFAEDNEELIELLKDFKPVKFDAKRFNEVQEKVYEAKAALNLHNNVKKRALEIRERLSELREALAEESALELILEGYADKAMKKMAIESISSHLMQTVNRYAALVFENYSFEFVWGTQIQMLVHRPEGTSDVRKLSGAESMLFTLILILSLLVFVPKSKRLSLLILDEPYASFSDGTAELFTKLLPHIVQVIPSVLIITPKSEFRVAGASEFTLVKQPGGTVLKKGHPNDL